MNFFTRLFESRSAREARLAREKEEEDRLTQQGIEVQRRFAEQVAQRKAARAQNDQRKVQLQQPNSPGTSRISPARANELMVAVVGEISAVMERGNRYRFRGALWFAGNHIAKDRLTAAAAQGANIDMRDDFGLTLLHSLAADGAKTGVEFLLSLGADPSITTSSGETTIDIVRNNGHQEILKLLEDAVAQRKGKSA